MTRLRKERFINRTKTFFCYSCNAAVNTAHYVYYDNGKESRIYRCPSCGFMFAWPLLLDLSSRQMDSVGDAELFHSSILKKLHEHLVVNKEINIVKKILRTDTFTALDIGCGTGWISSLWKGAGADVVGLEPSVARGEYAREKYRIKVIPAYIEELHAQDRYDVIIMRHVLEHFSDPFHVLEKALENLKNNGLLVVIVPNIDCIGRYLFESKWTWVLPSHCNFFNPQSLRQIALRAGFDPLKLYQTPSPLWYPESFLRLFPGAERLRASLYSKLTLLSLIPFAPIVMIGYLAGVSENLTLIARKR